MNFFTYHMPPFLTIMGCLYLVVAAPVLIDLLRQGYWRGVFGAVIQLLRRHWRLAGCGLALIVWLITFIDLPLTQFLLRADKVIHCYTFWDFICSCAEGGLVSGVIFTLLMLANYYKFNGLAAVSRISLMASIYAGLANGVLKFIFNRQRPSIGLEQWHFFAFFRNPTKHLVDLSYAFNSMPSGHTITTLAAITPFYLAYTNKWLRLALIFWALMVNFSRIYTINHWLSDVAMASMLGFLIGLASYQINQGRIDV